MFYKQSITMKLYRITLKKNLFSGPFYQKKSGVLYFVKKHYIYNLLDHVFEFWGIYNYVYIWEFDFPGRRFQSDDRYVLIPLEIVKLGKLKRVTKLKFEEFTMREYKHYIKRWREFTRRLFYTKPNDWLLSAMIDRRIVYIPTLKEYEEAFGKDTESE